MFPVYTLSGPPRQRGKQYGQAATAQIRHSIASYSRLFAFRRGVDWEDVQQQALAYVPVLQEYVPDLLEEMRGIAEGSGRSLAEIVALNARTELLAGERRDSAHPSYAEAMARNHDADVPEHGECTTIVALPSATAGHRSYLCQTWDWNGDQRAACVVLRIIEPGKPIILTVTEGGIVAKIGLNSAGVGVALNILSSLADGQATGIPVHVLLRMLLGISGLSDVPSLISPLPISASSCITVAEAGGQAVSLELTPGGIGTLLPENDLLVHTNHCCDAITQVGECPLPPISSSHPRFQRATALVAAISQGSITREDLFAILRDHEGGVDAICRHPNPKLHPSMRTESVLGAVMDLQARTLYLAPDVPCQAEFEALSLE